MATRDARTDFLHILAEVANPATTNYDRARADHMVRALKATPPTWHISGSYTASGKPRDAAHDGKDILSSVAHNDDNLQRDHAKALAAAINAGTVSVTGSYEI